MSKPQRLKKLSAKTVLSNVKKCAEGVLFDVFGQAVGIKAGESNYGTWEALIGEFKAVRIEDGKVFSSKVCFLPELAHDEIKDAVIAAQEKADDGKALIEFAYEVGKRNDEDLPAGYEYTVASLIEIETESDPLAKLMLKVENEQKKLAAPAKVEKWVKTPAVEKPKGTKPKK